VRSHRERTRTRPARYAYLLFYVALFGVGIAGFNGSPSPTVVRVLGSDWPVLLWSSVFVLFSLVGMIARLRNSLRTEAVAGFATAGALGMWGAMILIGHDSPATSIQGGLMFVAMALHHAGWSGILWWWSGTGLYDPDELRRALRRGMAEHRAEADAAADQDGGPRASAP